MTRRQARVKSPLERATNPLFTDLSSVKMFPMVSDLGIAPFKAAR